MSVHIDTLTFWFTQHPYLTTLLVFLAAATESLLVVGIIVPGAAIMVAAGILIGLDKLALWPTILAAIVGAITGDSISYWIGHFYKERLHNVWPFRTHPHWLPKVEVFFHQHGGKSVLFGRFVGPVRPFIPAVAGMLGMKPLKFYLVNIGSAIAWAPAYLLPGMAFGASLAMASLVATRLVMLLVMIVAAIVTILWLSKHIYKLVAPHINNLLNQLGEWAIGHDKQGKFILGLVDAEQSAVKPLLFFAALTIISAACFLMLFHQVISTSGLYSFDQSINQLMQTIRTPWGDRIMVFFTGIGSGQTLALFTMLLFLWLLWHRYWQVSTYWLAALGFGKLAVELFTFTHNSVAQSSFSFPSAHTTMSIVTYGFIAILIAHRAKPRLRWLYYALVSVFIFMIALSRLYLNVQSFTHVIAGLSLGCFWIALLAVAYFRHSDKHPVPARFSLITLIVFISVVIAQSSWYYSGELKRYTPKPQKIIRLKERAWLQQGWQNLPAELFDFDKDKHQVLSIQWQGSLLTIKRTLLKLGWKASPPLNFSNALRWLAPDYSLSQLPLLPQFYLAHADTLTMIFTKKVGQSTNTMLLRLWASHMVTETNNLPIWVGTVDFATTKKILLLNLPQTSGQYRKATQQLQVQLKMHSVKYELKHRKNGPLLLIETPHR